MFDIPIPFALLLLLSQLYLWRLPFGVRFLLSDRLFNPAIEVVTFRLRGWCMLGVFLLPAFTRLAYECRDLWVRAMECMSAQTRPRFLLSSERILGGMESEPMLIPTEKNPFYRRPRGGWNPRRCIRQDSEPNTLPTELFRPQPMTLHQAGRPAQHTTHWAIPAPTHDTASGRTASPTHYPLSYSGPNPWHCIRQDGQPNTLPTELFRPPIPFALKRNRWIQSKT